MNKQIDVSKTLTTLLITSLFVMNLIIPSILAHDQEINSIGFTRGVSWRPVKPVKKTTFVKFDETTYIDDYSYLSAVPTSVFFDKDKNRVFSYPLLFFQDYYPIMEDKERSLNARQGIDYFMEDWMAYCGGSLDSMTLINVPQDKIPGGWEATNYTIVEGDNPYSIAANLALQDWSFSENAVIAVIEEQFEKPSSITQGSVKGALPVYNIGYSHMKVDQPVIGSGGTYESFFIEDERYKYVVVRITWPDNADLDLQLYDYDLGMVDASGDFQLLTPGAEEIAASYINNYGKYEIGITIMPKKTISNANMEQENLFQNLLNLPENLLSKIMGNDVEIEITLLPGIDVMIKDPPTYGCRHANFTLTWDDPSVHLGFTLIDPAGTEIGSSIPKEEIETDGMAEHGNRAYITVPNLGECKKGENYYISVFSLNDVSQPVDFELTYTWHQTITPKEGNCLASASNGAVLASMLNSPLLYTSSTDLPECTKDVLYQLGVKNVYLINTGDHIEKSVIREIKGITDLVGNYKKIEDTYRAIQNISERNDIIFTTIDPWTYWYVGELQPAGEFPGALFIGPSAYLAAHHGSPVIIVDEHPELSQAIVYHNNLWAKTAGDRFGKEPSGGSMTLSGKRVYEFLEKNNFGKLEEGNNQIKETIITIAGQYDIGISWDRVFTGAAYPGRFWGSPVDTAYAICRNVFYPSLIFTNPGASNVQLINGSSSTIARLGGRIRVPRGVNLVITKPSQIEEFQYPLLQSHVLHLYKFNERADAHWGFIYTRADEIIPYITDSRDPIDDGITGEPGAFYPDITPSEVIPKYAERGGFDNVYSTNFSAITQNLNRGVILWVSNAHGEYQHGGVISLWDPESPYVYEENPWRGYEPIMLNPGNLREFIRWTFHIMAIYGADFLNLTEDQIQLFERLSSIQLIRLHLLGEKGSTENPDVALINPQLGTLNAIVNGATFNIFDVWGAFGIQVHRDRLLQPIQTILRGWPFITTYDGKVTVMFVSGSWVTTRPVNGLEFDDALTNLHSCGLHSCSCLVACTYLHLLWMRHGMSYQIIDPWVTSDYSGVWQQVLIKRLVMGDTVGESYERAMHAVGPEYLTNKWWWDKWQNVELFGDPDLRILVPNTEFSEENYWEQDEVQPLVYGKDVIINGHMPYGAINHPHQREPLSVFIFLFVVGIIILSSLIILVFLIIRRTVNK